MKDSATSGPGKIPANDVKAQATAAEHVNWQGSTPVTELHPEALTIRLTPREREVLTLLCQGLSNKAISRRLDIAVATVKVHVGNILRALDVSTRLEAVLLARCWDLTHDGGMGTPRGRPIPRRPRR
jgi:DNA-binding NarL/FixJ family response regulator